MFKHDIVERIAIAVAAVGIIFCVMYQLVATAGLPYVYLDTSNNNKCVLVEYSDGSKGTCDQLPEKYLVEYVTK